MCFSMCRSRLMSGLKKSERRWESLTDKFEVSPGHNQTATNYIKTATTYSLHALNKSAYSLTWVSKTSLYCKICTYLSWC